MFTERNGESQGARTFRTYCNNVAFYISLVRSHSQIMILIDLHIFNNL